MFFYITSYIITLLRYHYQFTVYTHLQSHSRFGTTVYLCNIFLRLSSLALVRLEFRSSPHANEVYVGPTPEDFVVRVRLSRGVPSLMQLVCIRMSLGDAPRLPSPNESLGCTFSFFSAEFLAGWEDHVFSHPLTSRSSFPVV